MQPEHQQRKPIKKMSDTNRIDTDPSVMTLPESGEMGISDNNEQSMAKFHATEPTPEEEEEEPITMPIPSSIQNMSAPIVEEPPIQDEDPFEYQERIDKMTSELTRIYGAYNDWDAWSKGRNINLTLMDNPEEAKMVYRTTGYLAARLKAQKIDADLSDNDTYEFWRDAIANQDFDGAGVGDDSAFDKQIASKATKYAHGKEFHNLLMAKAGVSSLMNRGGEHGFNKFLEEIGEHLGYDKALHANYLQAWNEITSDFDSRPREYRQVMNEILMGLQSIGEGEGLDRGDQANIQFDTLMRIDDEMFDMAVQDLLTYTATLPKPEAYSFWQAFSASFSRNVDAYVTSMGQSFTQRALRSYELGDVDPLTFTTDIPRARVPMTDEERKRREASTQEYNKYLNRRAVVKTAAENYDQIEGSSVGRWLGSALGTTATSLSMVVPYVGTAAMYASMEGAAREDLFMRGLQAGLSQEQSQNYANNVAPVVAVPQTALNKVQQLVAVRGKMPRGLQWIDRTMDKLDNAITNRVARYAGKVALVTGVETAIEIGEDLTQDVVMDLTNILNEEMPDVNWWEELSGYWNSAPDIAAEMIFLSFLGGAGGMNARKQHKAWRDTSELKKRAWGWTKETRERLDKAAEQAEKTGNFAEFGRELQEANKERDANSEEAQEAVEEFKKAQAKAAEFEEKMELANRQAENKDFPIFEYTNGAWSVIDRNTGEVIGSGMKREEAIKTAQDRYVWYEMQSVNEIAELGSIMLAQEKATEGNETARAELDELMTSSKAEQQYGKGAEERFDQQQEIAEGRGQETKKDAPIKGMRVQQMKKDGKSVVTRIFRGGDIMTVFHEEAHVRLKQAMAPGGSLTEEGVVEFLQHIDKGLSTKQVGDKQVGLKLLPDNFNELEGEARATAIDEAVAELMEVMVLRTRKKGGVKGNMNAKDIEVGMVSAMANRNEALGRAATGIASMLRALRQFWGIQFYRLAQLNKAVKDGTVSEEKIDDFLNKLYGLDSQVDMEQRTEREAQEMTGETPEDPSLGYSISYDLPSVPPSGAFYNINTYSNVTIKTIDLGVEEHISGIVDRDRHEEIKKLDAALYYRRGKKLVTTATRKIFKGVPPSIAKHPLAKYIKKFKNLSYGGPEVDLDLGNGVTFLIRGYRANSIKSVLQQLDELALGEADLDYFEKQEGWGIELDRYAKEFAENLQRRPTIEIGDASDSKSRAQRQMDEQRKKWGKDQRSGLQYVAQQEATNTITYYPAVLQTVTTTVDLAPIAQQLLDSLPEDVLTTPNVYNARRKRAAASWQGNYISTANTPETYVHEVMHVATQKRIEEEIDYPIARDSITDREGQQPIGAEYLKRIKEQAKSASPEMQELVRLYLLANKNFPELTKQSRTTGDPMSAQAKKAGISGSVGYGLANLHEFVAQTFSSRVFQEALNQIPDPKAKGMTLWQSLINAVRKMFGLNAEQGSVLESVIAATAEIAEMEAKPEVGFSISQEMDADYMAAVEAGDMDAAQDMVDQAAKAAGFWLKAFHQTASDEFHVFDMSRTGTGPGGRNTSFYKQAAYFTIDGPRIREMMEDFGIGISYGTREMQVYLKPDTEKDYVPYADLEMVKLGEDESGKEIAITDPERIKLADPVTRDDAGNVIPLSQRFDPEQPDIRFSIANLEETYAPATEEEVKAANKAESNKQKARSPILAVAAVRLANGEITVEDYADAVDVIDPFVSKGVETPPTEDDIRKYIGKPESLKYKKVGNLVEPGTLVEARIDIPTWNKSTAAGNSVYAVTLHKPVAKTATRVGETLSYMPMAHLKNAEMMTRAISGKGGAIRIAAGQGKTPLATVAGEVVSTSVIPEDISEYAEVSYNPIRSSGFRDVSNRRLVIGGEEAVSIGSRVYVKNPEYGQEPTGFIDPSTPEVDISYSILKNQLGFDPDAVPGTLANNANVNALDPNRKGEDMTWGDVSFSIGPRTLPEAMPVMSEDVFKRILNETDETAVIQIDRMKVGEIDGIPLQGGMFFPTIVENLSNRVVWAFNSKGAASDVINRVKNTGGYAKLVLMAEGNVIGNKTFATVWMGKVRKAIADKKLSKTKALKMLNEIRKTSEQATGHTKNWKTLEEVEKALMEMPQRKRGSNYFAKTRRYTAKRGQHTAYAKFLSQKMTAAGFPDAVEMVEQFEEPAFKGLPDTSIVGVIKIDPGQSLETIQTAEEAGVPEHLSYAYVIKGEPVARAKKQVTLDELRPETKNELLTQGTLRIPVTEGLSYSISQEMDADYMAVVEAGEMDAVQDMVDQAAKAAGYTIGPVWHGTQASFSKFKVGSAIGQGEGIYFSDDARDTEEFGDIQVAAYLSMSNPYTGTEENFKKLIQKTPNIDEEKFDEDGVYAGKLIQDAGFDGIIAKQGYGSNVPYGTEIVVFNPNQIKSADPITRDDAGNVIPLSQRFDPEQGDIRFQLGTDDMVVGLMDATRRRMLKSPEFKMAFFENLLKRLQAIQAFIETRGTAYNFDAFGKEFSGKFSDEKEGVLNALAMFEAIQKSLPPDLRGRLTGALTMAKQDTTEKQLEYLKGRIKSASGLVEKWMNREMNVQLKKLFKREKVTKNVAGKKPGGKAGADIHDIFAILRQAEKWSQDEVDAHVNGRLDAADNAETIEAEAKMRMEANLVGLVGNWKNASASRKIQAVVEATRAFEAGYATYKLKKLMEREDREIMRKELKRATGKAGHGAERDAKMLKEQGMKAGGKNFLLDLLSFEDLLGYIFGRNSAIVKKFVDLERKASQKKADFIQARAEGLEALFNKLAGGKLQGEKLRYKLGSVKSIESQGRKLTEFEALSATMMWMQEDGRRHMIGPKDDDGKPTGEWNYDEDFIAEIEAQLSDEAKAVRAHLLDVYGSEHAQINPTFRDINGINMPQNALYSPITVKPMQAGKGEMTDPTTGMSMSTASLTPGSLRTRGVSIAEPEFRDVVQTFLSHTQQIGHWLAYAPMMKDLSPVMRHRDVINSVESKAGQQGVRVLSKWEQYFTAGGIVDASAYSTIQGLLNRMLGRAAGAVLIGRLSVIIIQTTQLGAAIAEMPVGSYIYRFSKLFSPQGMKMWREAFKSSYIQRRLNEMPVVVREAMKGLEASKPSTFKYLVRKAGEAIGGMDALMTAGTYAIVYDYQLKMAKQNGMTGAEAERWAKNEAERSVERVAQPTRAGTRSIFENTATNPFVRVGWAFASEGRQKLALGLYRTFSKQTSMGEKGRALALMFLINGALGTLMRTAWRDMKDGEDDEVFDERYWDPKRLMLATLTEPLGGMPFVGDAIESGIYATAGEWSPEGNMLSSIPQAMEATWNLKDFGERDAMKNLKEVEKILGGLALANDTLSAASSVSHLVTDIAKLIEAALED